MECCLGDTQCTSYGENVLEVPISGGNCPLSSTQKPGLYLRDTWGITPSNSDNWFDWLADQNCMELSASTFWIRACRSVSGGGLECHGGGNQRKSYGALQAAWTKMRMSSTTMLARFRLIFNFGDIRLLAASDIGSGCSPKTLVQAPVYEVMWFGSFILRIRRRRKCEMAVRIGTRL